MSDHRFAKPTRRDLLRYGGLAAGLTAAAPALMAFNGTPVAAGSKFTGAFGLNGGPVPNFNVLTISGVTPIQMLYSFLVQWNVQFTQLQPALATSWSISDKSDTYTFKLRKGVKWHDGSPFTSADVKFTIELAANPDSAAMVRAYLPKIGSIDTPDESTVVLRLPGPDSTILSTLTFLPMLPQHLLSKYSAADLVHNPWWYTSPVGTGPFKFDSYVNGQFANLSAFKGFWGGAPKIANLVWAFYQNPASSVIALQKQTIQFDALAVTDLPTFQGNPQFKILSGSSHVVSYLWPSFKDPRLQKPAVRQAFMYAIDREQIVKQLYKGGGQVVNGPFDNPKYQSNSQVKYPYNPKKAKQLLASADWDSIKGNPIELVTYYSDTTSLNVLSVIQQMLSKVGISITIRNVDTATWATIEPTVNLAFVGLSNGPDPDLTRETFVTGGTNNHFSASFSDIDDLYAKGRVTTGTARDSIYRDLNVAFSKELPILPMWIAKRYAGISSNIKNFVWSPVSNGAYAANWQKWTVGSRR